MEERVDERNKNRDDSTPLLGNIESTNGNERASLMRYKISTMRQMYALFQKEALLKKRTMCSNILHVFIPVLICLLLYAGGRLASQLQGLFSPEFNSAISPSPFSINPNISSQFHPWMRDCFGFFFSSGCPDVVGSLLSNGSRSGLLADIPQGYCHFSNHSDWIAEFVPFFRQFDSSDSIDLWLFDTEKGLKNSSSFTSGTSYILPDGAVLFQEMNLQSLSFDYVVQYPDLNDNRNAYLYPFIRANQYTYPSEQFIAVVPSVLNMIHSTILHNVSEGEPALLKVNYTQFPYYRDFNPDNIVEEMGKLFYGLALSTLLPTFVYLIVLEKQQGLLEIMKMMGLNMSVYWLIKFCFDMALYLIIASIFTGLGLAFGFRTIRLSFGVFSCLLLIWGLALVSLSFFLSAFIGKNRTITAFLLYLFVLVCVGVGFGFNLSYDDSPLPFYLMLFPPFAFYRATYLMCSACISGSCLTFNDILHRTGTGDEIRDCFLGLGLEIPSLLVLFLYFDRIIPHHFGTRQSPLFPLLLLKQILVKYIFKFFQKSGKESIEEIDNVRHDVIVELSPNLEDLDDDVTKEMVDASNQNGPNCFDVMVRSIGLVKRYGRSDRNAVDEFFLCVRKGECFGLLGPNGSGKTTIISMLTQLLEPTNGTFRVCGALGVCPQFDLHWPSLTVQEHILFYSRLKGVPSHLEKSHCNELASSVGLTPQMSKKSSQLSGGMKRRLSLAMAFAGNPPVLFLDEPTTGLDPSSRRQVWGVLEQYKRKSTTMVLTTHSMEEADSICTRVGIITLGRLKCIGPQMYLKNKFGKGYSFSVSYRDGFEPDDDQFVQLFGKVKLKFNSVGQVRNFQIPPARNWKVSEVIQQLEERKDELGIRDWSLSQTTLEDVFMSICIQDEEQEMAT